MKKLFFIVSILTLGFVNQMISQHLQPERGIAHKHATVKVSDIEQTAGDGEIKLKTPNPHWQPPDWNYDREKVIYRQPEAELHQRSIGIREASPLPDTTFAGLVDNNTSIPPDVNGAAGPDNLMQTLNTEVRISDKDGQPLFTTTLSAFWSDLPGSGSTFDPRIVYDPYLDCWIMVTPSGSGVQSKIFFAISTSTDPLGDWNMYWFDPDTSNQTWFDYPNLGFNKNWISIGGIQRDSQFDAIDYVVFAIDKMAAYNGEDNPTVSRFTTQLGSAIVPSFTYDPQLEELYLISTGDGNDEGYGYVNLFKLSGPVNEPTLEMLGAAGVPEPWENWSYEYHGDFLPQLGSETLNSVDARMHTMITRNNKLWAVHHIYLPADDPERCAVQWWCFDTTGVILERDRIDDPDNGFSFAYPSIAVNANEDIMIGHGVFSSSQYAGAGYSFKAYYDDANTTRDFYEYKAGLAPYYKTYGGDRNRWGDYSAVFVDPDHDVNFWAMHEYAELPGTQDQWGTWWAYYRPSFPPQADFVSDEILIPVGETVNFTDLTLGIPETWSWTFEGAIPEVSDVQNPQDILYESDGVFDVTLIVSNELGTDTIIREGWITASSTILPEVNFEADFTVPCTEDTVSFSDLTKYSPIQWNWEFEPSTVTFVNGTDESSRNPQLVFDEAGSYTVTLSCWNLNGSSDQTKPDMIAAGGYEPFYRETFESATFKSEDWTIENPDKDVTWEFFETGGTAPGLISAGIDFSKYFKIGEKDRLISPLFNLENLSAAYLQFQHAYAKRHEDFTDSLLVYISDDCGITWTKVFFGGEDGSGNFATHEPADGFWPSISSDWCMWGWGASCISIDLSPWSGKSNIRIAFESWSAFGNPMFIDNIEIGQFVGLEDMGTHDEEVLIYPNPADDGFNILLTIPGKFRKAELVNHLGQLVYSRVLDTSRKQMRIPRGKDWATGVYFLTLSGRDVRVVKKISFY